MKPFQIKRFHRLLLLPAVFLLLFFCACGAPEDKGAAQITSFADLTGKKIGATTGSIQAIEAGKRFPDAELVYFSNGADMLNALRSGKIDVFVESEALAIYMMAQDGGIRLLDEKLGEPVKAGPIFAKTEAGKKLCDDYSGFIRECKENGLYDELQKIWYGDDESKRTVPDLDQLEAKNGTLRMAFDAAMAPFVYIKDGKPVGIDLDLTFRYCKSRGYAIEALNMDFSGIIPSIVAGKSDFACGGVAYTPERAESVYFGEPTYEGSSVVCAPDTGGAAGAGFWASVSESFEKTFVREDRWQMFFVGIGNTILISGLSILLGTLLGYFVYKLCRKGGRVSNAVTKAVIWLVQGMPVVVLLMILYYIVFGSIDIAAIWVAVAAFTLIFGSSMYALLVSGVKAVNYGQTEAAYALGYRDKDAFKKIILPQAAAHFMPGYRAEVVSLIKGTAVVGYITVLDLTRIGDLIRSRTMEAFFPLIAVTILYFLIAAVFKWVVGRIMKRLDPKRRTSEKILKGVDTHD